MIALIFAAISAFAQAFGGSWVCHSGAYLVPWKISVAPGEKWTTVRWGDQDSARGGIAFVAYIPAMHKWVYRDFHYDGSYSDITGTRSGNTWTWTGPFYAISGRIFNGEVQWTLASKNRIERTFATLVNGKLKPSDGDFCVRASAAAHPR